MIETILSPTADVIDDLDLPASKKLDLDEIFEEQYKIPIEGYFNFYAVPWNRRAYVKFPTSHIQISQRSSDLTFASHTDTVEDYEDERLTAFMSSCYLGTARLTDTHRLRYVLGNRNVELELEK